MIEMQKVQIALFLVSIIFINGFSQENRETDIANNAIILDLFPMVPGVNGYKFGEGMGLGFMYERKLHTYFSILEGCTFSTNFKEDISYSLSTRFRIYPFETAIKNFFTDIAILYSRNATENDNLRTISGMSSIGWNFIFRNGLVLVPGAFYRHKIADITGVKPYNYGFGFIMGIGLAF